MWTAAEATRNGLSKITWSFFVSRTRERLPKTPALRQVHSVTPRKQPEILLALQSCDNFRNRSLSGTPRFRVSSRRSWKPFIRCESFSLADAVGGGQFPRPVSSGENLD